jgi:hypothetical protein
MALDTTPKQEGGKLKAVASGTLPSGQPVVVNADGTVSVVGIGAASLGSIVTFKGTATFHMASTYDTNAQRIVIVYKDNASAGYGTAIVGTVSGSSISFGSPVVMESNNSDYYAITYDASAQKVVVAYRDLNNSFYGYARVGTVSGTSISFGSKATFEGAVVWHIAATYDTNAQKVIIAYTDNGNSDSGTAIVGTVSGTSISFGSAAVFESGSSYDNSITYDANAQKVVVSYYDGNNSSYGTAAVGTVSGTSISFGSPVVFESAQSQHIASAYDTTNNTVVIAYMDGGDSDKGKAVIGTVSGTSISFNSPTVFFDTAGVSNIAASYNSNAGAVVISFRGASAYGTVIDGTTTASSITFGSPLTITTNAYSSTYSSSTYDPITQKVVVSYTDQDDGNKGKAVVYSSAATNLTSENYIGISTGGAVADGGNATVGIIGSVSDEQSGLTAGQQYYVQADGTVGTTPADPSVLAGTAISATKMLVKT